MAKKLSAELKALKKDGVIFEADWNDGTRILSVKLPLDAAQWADVCNRNGKFLPMCCGDISSMRDILLDALRDEGSIRAGELRCFIELAQRHGSWTSYFEDMIEMKQDPIWVIINLYKKVEPYLDPDDFHKESNPDDVRDAIDIVAAMSRACAWENFYSNHGNFGHIVTRVRTLREFGPALKTVMNHLAGLNLGTVEGWAIVDKSNNSVYETNRGGWAVYETEEIAKKMLVRWSEDDEKVKANGIIRPCRVSLEKGYEFLDPAVELPKTVQDDNLKQAAVFLSQGLQDLVKKAIEQFGLLPHHEIVAKFEGNTCRAAETGRFVARIEDKKVEVKDGKMTIDTKDSRAVEI